MCDFVLPGKAAAAQMNAIATMETSAAFQQEPDTYNMKWEQTSVPGLQSVYLNLLPVLFKINQGVPFMVQGTGQAALVNWGDGFITDEATIQSYSGMSDANGFFQGIMTSPYLRQVSRLYVSMLFGSA